MGRKKSFLSVLVGKPRRKKSFLSLLVGKPPPLRPQNFCGACGYHWYPRGKNFSPRCPRCGAERVAPSMPSTGRSGSAVPFVVLGCFGACVVGLVSLCCLFGALGTRRPAGVSRATSGPSASTPVLVGSTGVAGGDAGATVHSSEHLCGSPHARGAAARRPGWSRWTCRSESDTSWWHECLPRSGYAVHHGEGCPGMQRCCPPGSDIGGAEQGVNEVRGRTIPRSQLRFELDEQGPAHARVFTGWAGSGQA